MTATAHRPFPMPITPWLNGQAWNDLLFANWPIPVEIMRQAVPAVLPLDLYDGYAWISLVPFFLTDFRARFLPAIPGFASFLETNLRTYVTVGGKPGVYFFSLDAARLWAVIGARIGFSLPYYHARMTLRQEGDWLYYTTHRIRGDAEFVGRYRSTGPAATATPGSLDYFLAERYCLYAVTPGGMIRRAEIHHGPWRLEPAELHIERNSLGQAAGFQLSDPPALLNFSKRQEVAIWLPVTVPASS